LHVALLYTAQISDRLKGLNIRLLSELHVRAAFVAISPLSGGAAGETAATAAGADAGTTADCLRGWGGLVVPTVVVATVIHLG